MICGSQTWPQGTGANPVTGRRSDYGLDDLGVPAFYWLSYTKKYFLQMTVETEPLTDCLLVSRFHFKKYFKALLLAPGQLLSISEMLLVLHL